MNMKKLLFLLSVTTLTAAFGMSILNANTTNLPSKATTQTDDSLKYIEVHSIIKRVFHNLPLEKSRLDLREVILNDKRFILTDTNFNNYPPSTFFKGITADKGLIQSNLDSIQVMLIYGNAALTVEKGGQEDSTKHPMILEFNYFFSNKKSGELEYNKLLNLVQRICDYTSSIEDEKWEAQFSKSSEKCIGKIIDHFDPYYRLGIAYISVVPVDQSNPYYVLNIVFSKEDK